MSEPWLKQAQTSKVENKGLATATGCTGRIRTETTDPYFGRWGDETNEQSVDIHPGAERRLTLMRFVPSGISFYRKRDLIVARIFDALEDDYQSDGVNVNGINYHAQRPVHQKKETKHLGDQQEAFFGRQVPVQAEYDGLIELGATDWGRTINIPDKISPSDAVTEGRWETSFHLYNQHDELVEKLEDYGW